MTSVMDIAQKRRVSPVERETWAGYPSRAAQRVLSAQHIDVSATSQGVFRPSPYPEAAVSWLSVAVEVIQRSQAEILFLDGTRTEARAKKLARLAEESGRRFRGRLETSGRWGGFDLEYVGIAALDADTGRTALRLELEDLVEYLVDRRRCDRPCVLFLDAFPRHVLELEPILEVARSSGTGVALITSHWRFGRYIRASFPGQNSLEEACDWRRYEVAPRGQAGVVSS